MSNVWNAIPSFSSTVPLDYAGKPVRLESYLADRIFNNKHIPRSLIRRLCDHSHILVNSIARSTHFYVSSGDVVSLNKSQPLMRIEPQDIPLDILYEDEHILAVNKASGMVVHPAIGVLDNTFVNAFMHHIKVKDSASYFKIKSDVGDHRSIVGRSRPDNKHKSKDLSNSDIIVDGSSSSNVCEIMQHPSDVDSQGGDDVIGVTCASHASESDSSNAGERYRDRHSAVYKTFNNAADIMYKLPVMPGIVHRLDSGTSGVLLAAKNPATQDIMRKKFALRQVHKAYLAVCFGNPGDVTLDSPIGASEGSRGRMQTFKNLQQGGKHAVSHVKTLVVNKHLSLVLVIIETGRTHQIRVHLQSIGAPIVQDNVYGDRDMNEISRDLFAENRIMLHAVRTQFHHPVQGNLLDIVAPLSPSMAMIVKRLCNNDDVQYESVMNCIRDLTDNLSRNADN